jgi:hypothetical protein
MIKFCIRCGLEDGPLATIHEHHKNGNHRDNRPENKIFLCANCHMTLHWKRWKLSDIGLLDVEIIRYHPSLVQSIYKLSSSERDILTEKIIDLKLENENLKNQIVLNKTNLDSRIDHLNKIIIQMTKMIHHHNYALGRIVVNYINIYYNLETLPSEKEFRIILRNQEDV